MQKGEVQFPKSYIDISQHLKKNQWSRTSQAIRVLDSGRVPTFTEFSSWFSEFKQPEPRSILFDASVIARQISSISPSTCSTTQLMSLFSPDQLSYLQLQLGLPNSSERQHLEHDPNANLPFTKVCHITDILYEISSFLCTHDLTALICSCKSLQYILDGEYFWRELAWRDFGEIKYKKKENNFLFF